MLKVINPIPLLWSHIGKNLRKDVLRMCQTTPKETEPAKSENQEDSDMFISDIPNPFEKKKLNPRLLSQFVSPYTGFIYDRHITGLCAAQQKRLVLAIKRSQSSGFLPYRLKIPKYLKDPKLFDPFSPSRPNPY